MLFMVYLLDDPARTPDRATHRGEHRAYIDAIAAHTRMVGRLLDAEGGVTIGSLLVVDFPSRAALEEWLQGEPYMRQGIYRNVQIHRVEERVAPG